jgi:hypothetical protein
MEIDGMMIVNVAITLLMATLVGPATTSGGLYVGVTRGRHTNVVHLVATDVADARAQLVAALGRDRSDRGLDIARARAETEAVPVASTGPEVEVDRWVTAAELDAAARRIERELLAALASVPMAAPVVGEDETERQERAGRLAA